MSKTIRSACRNKHEENWDGLYVDTVVKPLQKKMKRLGRHLNVPVDKVSKWYEEYLDDCYEAAMDDCDDYLSFDEWLSWNHKLPEEVLSRNVTYFLEAIA